MSRRRFSAGLAGGGDSFQDIPGADVLEGKFHTPSVRLLAWRGVSNRRKRLTATVPIDLAAHFSSKFDFVS